MLLLLLIFSFSVIAEEDVLLQSGFVTGNMYQSLDKSQKNHYVMGVVDGLLLSPLLKAPETEAKDLSNCLVGVENRQLLAVVNKHMADNPELWHQPMHILVCLLYTSPSPRD